MQRPKHKIDLKCLTFLRGIFAYAFVALFTVMSTFASGTMLENHAQGISIVICTGDGSHTIQIDADGNPIAPKHTPCEWSVRGLAIEGLPMNLVERELFYTRVVHQPISHWLHPAIAHTQLNNRGPPILL